MAERRSVEPVVAGSTPVIHPCYVKRPVLDGSFLFPPWQPPDYLRRPSADTWVETILKERKELLCLLLNEVLEGVVASRIV